MLHNSGKKFQLYGNGFTTKVSRKERKGRKGKYNNLTQRRRERRGFILLSGYKTYTLL